MHTGAKISALRAAYFTFLYTWYTFNHHFYFTAQLVVVFTLSDLLDMQWSQAGQVSSPLPLGTCLYFSNFTQGHSRVFYLFVICFVLYTSICFEMVECHQWTFMETSTGCLLRGRALYIRLSSTFAVNADLFVTCRLFSAAFVKSLRKSISDVL